MNERAIPDAVITDQHAASDPARSVWLSANAGAGKTHVLAQRVIRLLLDGTDPAKILCLTFTKAAAANMANRIFETLSEWIAFDDEKLDAAIRATGAHSADGRHRVRARRLFASALETPGGLKVQTIHGFCARLLQQFPFEANVAARFRVLEETEQSQILEQIRRDVLLEAARQPDSRVGRALAALIPLASDFGFQTALDEAIRERAAITASIEQAGGLDAAMAQLTAALDIVANDTVERVEAEIVGGTHLPFAQWAGVAGICAQGSSNDQRQGQRLTEAAAASGATRLDAYLSVFFSEEDKARKQIVTASIVRNEPELARRLSDEQARLVALCEKRRAILARDRTAALLTIAIEVIDRYAAKKDHDGLLDYDDLIAHTRNMLDRVESTWVHYKLDLGIDHLLIDEAQDTSPQQWDIVTRFVAEFTHGAGARGKLRRSIFAVGDDKQSIFSFQDAAPEAFSDMRRYFEGAHAAAGLPFQSVSLKYSFRSVPIVLNAVDVVFQQPAVYSGLTTDPVPTIHEAVRVGAPGVVELWPLVEPDERPEVDPWDAPFDTRSERSPRVKLARQIATAVKTWIDRHDQVGDGDQRRAVRPGDILVLVRQRGALFEAIIRAIKASGIPVAGADRLKLTEHIAVMDLLVLADALLLPDDDLALATALKSPLFGMSEQELFDLAHGRDGALAQRLRAQRPELSARFEALREAARRLSPFAFYAELLGPGGGRKAFLARLGAEANDAIDEFLNLALDYERRNTPSLQGFVAWLRTASAEVKRDMEIARDEVRVMTVHGAKGLEAPIVVLADTTTQPAGPAQYQPRLLGLPRRDAPPQATGCMVWIPTRRDDTASSKAARTSAIQAAENEYRRLLYVAMTRAADRLIICGAIVERTMPQGCWYQLVEQGLTATGLLTEAPGDFGEGSVLRYRATAAEVAQAPPSQTTTDRAAPPDWLTKPVAAVEPRAPAIAPSRLAVQPGDTGLQSSVERRHAIERGTLVHRLLQSLPDVAPERRTEAARRFLARAHNFSDAERHELARQVLQLLANPQFAALFAPGSRAEISIAGRVGGRLVSGQVDRLVITPEAVLIADYKTNRPAPRNLDEALARTPQYVAQLALYRAVLARLYPDKPVQAALLWTDIPMLMEIPAAALDAAIPAILTPA
jgi:ATP-dependent helicase/nuclease subunit A